MKQYLIRFVIITTILSVFLSVLYIASKPLYEDNLERKEQEMVNAMVGAREDVHFEIFDLLAPRYLHLGTEQNAHRVFEKDNDTPSAIIVSTLAKDGYGGPIALMVSFDNQCRIDQVEIIRHAETPGLGDQFLNNGKAWLKSFHQKSLQNTNFKLKKFGGDIDAWTGATVTPKAISKALEEVLQMCDDHSTQLFSHAEAVYLESR